MRKPIILKLILFLLLPLSVLAAVFFAIPGPSKAVAQDRITLVIDTDFPPYSYASKGSRQGYLIDLFQVLEVVLGRKITPRFEDLDKGLEEIKNGTVDGILGAPVKNSWKRSVSYSAPFDSIEYAIFMDGRNRHINSLRSLRGTLVGVYEHSYILDTLQAKDLTLVKTKSIVEGLKMLRDHEITALVAEKNTVLYYLDREDYGDIRIAPPDPGLVLPLAIAAGKDNHDLLKDLNNAVTSLEINGVFEKLSKKWLSGLVVTPVPWRRVVLTTAKIMAGIITVLVLIWVISLRTTISIKTRQIHTMSQRIVEREKLSLLGKMASQVAHELRSPLSIIKSTIYLLRREDPHNRDLIKERLDSIDDKINLASKILESIVSYTNVRSGVVSEIIVKDCVDEVFRDLEVPEGIRIDLLQDEGAIYLLYMDFHQLYSILRNLIVNAIQAMGASGLLTMRLFMSTQGKDLNIRIADTGKGMPENVKNRIFSVFYSTKTTGSGLGLPIARSLTEANGGKLILESSSPEGTSFLLSFPSGKCLKK